jgi:hypothetical protein
MSQDLTTWADRMYAERFDRMPTEEPWRSRWCRVEALHYAALAGGRPTVAAACKLADERYAVKLDYQKAMGVRMAAGLMGRR